MSFETTFDRSSDFDPGDQKTWDRDFWLPEHNNSLDPSDPDTRGGINGFTSGPSSDPEDFLPEDQADGYFPESLS